MGPAVGSRRSSAKIISLFTPEQQWTEAAELPGIPGLAVAVALAVFFVGVVVFALWPAKRRAEGEIHGQ